MVRYWPLQREQLHVIAILHLAGKASTVWGGGVGCMGGGFGGSLGAGSSLRSLGVGYQSVRRMVVGQVCSDVNGGASHEAVNFLRVRPCVKARVRPTGHSTAYLQPVARGDAH